MEVPDEGHAGQQRGYGQQHLLPCTVAVVTAVLELDRQLGVPAWLVQVQLDLVQDLGHWRFYAGVELLHKKKEKRA